MTLTDALAAPEQNGCLLKVVLKPPVSGLQPISKEIPFMPFMIHLLWRHLRQYPGRALTALVVLAVTATIMLALAGAGAALRFRLGHYLEQLFPEERIRLEAGRMGLGPVAIEGRPISDEILDTLKKRPDVAEVLAIEAARFPIVAEGTLFGQTIASEAVVYGVPRDLIADALKPGVQWQAPPDDDGVYPLVASSYFVDMYNMGFARANGLPLLNPGAILGRELDLHLGESMLGIGNGSGTNSRTIRCRLVGLTASPAMIGLALPAEVIRQFNTEFAAKPRRQYVAVVVRLNRGGVRESFVQEVARMGLVQAGSDVLGERMMTGVRVASWILMTLAGAVMALGLLLFYLLFAMIFHSRRLDLIRLRAFGVSPRGVVGLALGEVCILAGVAVAVAAVAIWALARWAGAMELIWQQNLAWLPKGLFALPLGWLALASVVMLLLALIPALPMLWSVVKSEPAAMIRDL